MANKMQPIRNIEKIEEMKKKLMKKNYRDYLLFLVGINTGLRISDILKLKVGDVKNKVHIYINEEKTNKEKKVIINSKLREEFKNYITEDMEEKEYLFKSREGNNKPISRVQAYRILKKVADEIGLEKCGTHTLRKTFGYHHYQRNKDVALLQDLFNHSSPSTTLRYIGINQDIMDKSLENFSL